MTLPTKAQREICTRFATGVDAPAPHTKLGVALQTRGQLPLNAFRHPAEGDTCGWYLWWGDTLTEDPEFFHPMHVLHMQERCPEIVPYLALPPGWRVQLAPGHEDVWYDEKLLNG